MKKALITGGGGFIGTRLARRLLEDDYRVDLVDNLSRGRRDADLDRLLEEEGVRFVERDLLAPDALAGLDGDYTAVFHLAAIVGVANVLDAPYRVLTENTALTIAAIEFARDQPRLERFLFASTSEVYAGTLRLSMLPIPTPEDVPIALPELKEARTSYLLSKLYGEALSLQSGLPVTVIRPHNVYGPRMGLSHVIPELLQRAHNAADGEALQVYSVDHTRTFCHVRDAVEIIARAVASPACAGEVLNVGSQRPEVRIGDLARMVVEVVGRDLEIEPLPATPGSPLRRCPDMSKTTRLTGHEAAVGLQEGIRDTYEWYRARVFAVEAR